MATFVVLQHPVTILVTDSTTGLNMCYVIFEGGWHFVMKCHGGREGFKKWSKLHYVINEWPLTSS